MNNRTPQQIRKEISRLWNQHDAYEDYLIGPLKIESMQKVRDEIQSLMDELRDMEKKNV